MEYSVIFFILFNVCSRRISANRNNHLAKIASEIPRSDLILCESADAFLDALRSLPKIVQNSAKLVDDAPPRKFDHYFLEFPHENHTEITKKLENLRNTPRWNSRAKFVITHRTTNRNPTTDKIPNNSNGESSGANLDKSREVYDLFGVAPIGIVANLSGENCFGNAGYLSKLFGILSKFYVYNVAVLTGCGAFTYDPYAEENFNEPKLERREVVDEYFPAKLPRLWRNTTLDCLAVNFVPYVIDVKRHRGTDLELVEEILAPKLGVKVNFLGGEKSWGRKLADGSYTGVAGRLFGGFGDFGVGHFHVRHTESLSDFDTTFSYADDAIVWVVPKSELKPHWSNLVGVYEPEVWLAVWSIGVALGLLCFLIPKLLTDEDGHFKNLWNAATFPLRFLFGQLTRRPKTYTGKLLFLTTWFFVYDFHVIWDAHLIYHLTHGTRYAQVSTTKDLAASNLRILLPPNLSKLVSPDARTSLSKREILAEFVAERNAATATSKKLIQFRQFSDLSLRQSVFVFSDEIVLRDFTVMFFRKGNPLFERVNWILIGVKSAGLMERIELRLFHWLAVNETRIAAARTGQRKRLGLQHLIGVFWVYVGGNAAALLAFLGEFLLCKPNKRF